MGSNYTSSTAKWVSRLARLQPWYLLTKYPNRLTRSLFAFVNACISIAVMTAAALYTKQPLIFPSLGPSAFLFFYRPSAPSGSPRNAILAHGAGVLIGWGSAWLIGSQTLGAQVAAVGLSLGLISAVMIAADIPHPPAASSTLIVSLGLITDWTQIAGLMAGVVLLTAQAFVINRLSGVAYPLWKARAEHDRQGLVVSALETQAASAPSDPYAAVADQLVARKKVAPPGDESG